MAHPTQDQLEAQAFAFSQCATESTDLAIDAEIHGDAHCACEHDCRALWYWWGVDVLSRTPSDDCDCDDKCVDPEFACKVINLLAPGCVTCGCGSADDVPYDCTIEQNWTVYQALDADQQTVVPNVAGRTTLIISDLTDAGNDWADNVGSIATDDGAGSFTYYVPPNASIVLSSDTSTYYVTYPGGAGPLYPPIDGNQDFAELTLVSRFPSITSIYDRTVVVEVSEDGTTWVPVYSGPETPLAYGVLVTLTGGLLPVETRTTYYYGEEDQCSFQYAEGTIPPFVPPPCGVLVYSVTPESTCATDNWTIDVEFTQIDGWNIGEITPTVNGVAGTPVAITLGTLTFGPYVMGDLVTFDLTNNLDAGCDITTAVQADPRVGEQDFTVLKAVDADEYATLSGDGNDYYIVSDVNGSADPWAAHVGEIWLGGSSTYQAVANLEIVYASNPGGALGFWQDDAGTPKQLFPQPTLTFNTVTLVSVVTLPPVAPFTQAWNLLFVQAQWTVPTPGSATAYTGPPGSFVTTPVAIPTTVPYSSITGTANYSDGCAVRVPFLKTSYTPTGDPDPDISNAGFDGVVRDVVETDDGVIIAVGSFDFYDPAGTPVTCNNVGALNGDLTLNTAVNDLLNDPGASFPGFNNGRVDNVFIDSQGRIVISGLFTTYNDLTINGLVRLNPDFTLDTTFNAGTLRFGGFFNCRAEPYPGDKIIVTGIFTSYDGVPCGRICRLNSDGSLDTTFNSGGAGFNAASGYARAIGNDILVLSGSFATYNGTTVLNVAGGADMTLIRLDYTGALMNVVAQFPGQFQQPGFPTNGMFLDQTSDGNIVITGSYTDYNGTTVGRFMKMDLLGTPNAAYMATLSTAFDLETTSVDEMPNGQVMVGSSHLADFNGVATGGLIRLNADGTRDLTWNPSPAAGFNQGVIVVYVTRTGSIIAGGQFTTYNGVTYRNIIKFI